MPIKKTHYEILGVPRTAAPEQIKKRYRQLVRQHHPDVAKDKAAAKTAFIEITEAYQTLSNADKRVIYDTSLDAQMFSVQTKPRETSRAQQRPTTRRTYTAPRNRNEQAKAWVQEAQSAFIRRQFRSAINACKEARQLDPKNVEAAIILGDIYKIIGQTDNAIAMYTIAVQLDPKNADVQIKLNRLTRHAAGAAQTPGEQSSILKLGLNLMGWSAAAFLLLLLAMNPGQPIGWLGEHLPFVDTWSTMLLVAMSGTGVLAGFLMSVSELIEPLDEELFFRSVRSSGTRSSSYPVGLLLILFNFFSFYLAAGMYLLIAVVQEGMSKSIAKVFAATALLMLLAALIYYPGTRQVLLFGGNVVFASMLFGWLVGDMFRPGW